MTRDGAYAPSLLSPTPNTSSSVHYLLKSLTHSITHPLTQLPPAHNTFVAMTTHIPAVMDNPAVLSCLVKHAIRLGRSVRHPDFGLAVTYSGNKGKPGAITQQHILTIALHPEPQADMLDIHVTKTASRYEGKLEELSAALQAALKQSNGQGASPNDRTVTLVVKADETPTRSLGELFSDACHGPLLQEVVAYLPEKEILRLTRVSSSPEPPTMNAY